MAMKLFRLICLSLLGALLASACSKEAQRSSGRTAIENPSPAIGADGTLAEAIGIATQDGKFEALLAKGCTLPCAKGQDFVLAKDQKEMKIRLFRGNADLAKDATPLALVTLGNLQPAPEGEELTVMFNVAAGSEGITVSARQMMVNTDVSIAIEK
jgi:molecular chaperone DnaK (HSP70)